MVQLGEHLVGLWGEKLGVSGEKRSTKFSPSSKDAKISDHLFNFIRFKIVQFKFLLTDLQQFTKDWKSPIFSKWHYEVFQLLLDKVCTQVLYTAPREIKFFQDVLNGLAQHRSPVLLLEPRDEPDWELAAVHQRLVECHISYEVGL